jgi:hypothetical protein
LAAKPAGIRFEEEIQRRRFPDSSSGFVVERTFKNFLLLSKRKHVIIPVGNLKVDSP